MYLFHYISGLLTSSREGVRPARTPVQHPLHHPVFGPSILPSSSADPRRNTFSRYGIQNSLSGSPHLQEIPSFRFLEGPRGEPSISALLNTFVPPVAANAADHTHHPTAAVPPVPTLEGIHPSTDASLVRGGVHSSRWFPLGLRLPPDSQGRILMSTAVGSSSPSSLPVCSSSSSASSFSLRADQFSTLYPLLIPAMVGFAVYWSMVPAVSDLSASELLSRALVAIGHAREVVDHTSMVLTHSTPSLPVDSPVPIERITGPVAPTVPLSDPLSGGMPLDRSVRGAAVVLGGFCLVLLLTCAAAGIDLSSLGDSVFS